MKSTGYKMNKNLVRFLSILGVTSDTFGELGITEAQAVHEIRAITGKYQALEFIESDLAEMHTQTQVDVQSVEPVTVAANDNED